MAEDHPKSALGHGAAARPVPMVFHDVPAAGPLAIHAAHFTNLRDPFLHTSHGFAAPAGPLVGGGDLQVAAFDRTGAVALHRPHAQGWRTLIARIIAFEQGAGKYAAHLLFGNSTATASENLSLPEGLSDSGNNNALLVNAGEIGGSHQLPLQSVHGGVFVGMTAESPPRAIMLLHSSGPVLQPVQVKKDGGIDGTQTAPASWTYTLLSLDGTLTYATQTPLARPRPNGSCVPPSANPAFGTAFVDAGGMWRLWDAGEIPATAPCS
jgi:hypothetical protein